MVLIEIELCLDEEEELNKASIKGKDLAICVLIQSMCLFLALNDFFRGLELFEYQRIFECNGIIFDLSRQDKIT